MAGSNGIQFTLGKEKNPSTPLYPTRKSGVEVLAGFVEFALHNRDDKKLTAVLSEGLESPAIKKLASMYKLAAGCGEDLTLIAQLYDRINGTLSSVCGDEIVSIPGPNNKGVGFFPILLWDELKWHNGTTWVTGFLADPVADEEGRYVIADEEDPMSATQRVKGSLIRRK